MPYFAFLTLLLFMWAVLKHDCMGGFSEDTNTYMHGLEKRQRALRVKFAIREHRIRAEKKIDSYQNSKEYTCHKIEKKYNKMNSDLKKILFRKGRK